MAWFVAFLFWPIAEPARIAGPLRLSSWQNGQARRTNKYGGKDASPDPSGAPMAERGAEIKRGCGVGHRSQFRGLRACHRNSTAISTGQTARRQLATCRDNSPKSRVSGVRRFPIRNKLINNHSVEGAFFGFFDYCPDFDRKCKKIIEKDCDKKNLSRDHD
jgi:hypothetical protein